MLTHRLSIAGTSSFFKILHSTVLFRQLQALELKCPGEVHILPYLEQIKELCIFNSKVPAYPLNIHLPLVHTLRTLRLYRSKVSWMLGRTFTVLSKCVVEYVKETSKDLSWWNALQVNMPACVDLEWKYSSAVFFPFVSCPNLQVLRWSPRGRMALVLDEMNLNSLHIFLRNSPRLRTVEISIYHNSRLDSLLQCVLCDARAEGALQGIKHLRVTTLFYFSFDIRSQFFDRMVQYAPDYKKWWKEFTVENVGYEAVDLTVSCM